MQTNQPLIKSRAAVPIELHYADLLIWMDLLQAVAFAAEMLPVASSLCICALPGRDYGGLVSTQPLGTSELPPFRSLDILLQLTWEEQLQILVTKHRDSGRQDRIFQRLYGFLNC